MFSLRRILPVAMFFALAAMPVSDLYAQQPAPAQPTPDAPRNASPFGGINIGSFYGQLLDSMLTEISKPEVAAKLAKFQKQYFDALRKEGFSHEDAMKIVIANQVPIMPSSK